MFDWIEFDGIGLAKWVVSGYVCVGMHEEEKASLLLSGGRLSAMAPFRATEEYQFDSTSDNDNGYNSTPIGQWRREIVRLRRKLAT